MSSTLSAWGVPVLVFLVAASTFYLLLRLLTRKPKGEVSRIRALGSDRLSDEDPDEGLFGPLNRALAAQIPESGKERRDFKLLLRQAGLYGPTAATTIYAMRFVCLILPMVVAGILAVVAEADQTWKILFSGALAAAGLSSLPRLYVFFRRRRRVERIRRGLADTIDMLSMCTSGGLAIGESLEHVARQISAYPELAEELVILKRQAEVGSLKQALADLTARVDLPEIRQLATLLSRGTSLGTRLAGSLNEQADHLRTSRRQAATARANKTPVKMVLPVLFCFAPAALILLTAPAMLDLRDFLVPRAVAADGTAPATPTFGTGAIVNALESLNQGPQPGNLPPS
jgi:tight adherence protein C